MTELPMTLADVSSDWLTDALRAGGVIREASVTGFDWQILGEGVGFIGQLARIRLQYDRDEDGAPPSIVAKFPSPIPQNRGFGVVARLYETEIRFYHELAERLPVRVPRMYFGAFDPEATSSKAVSWVLAKLPGRVTMSLLDFLTNAAAKSGRRYALLIEDLGTAHVGDQVAGCGIEQGRAALRALARLHGSMWNSPVLDDWVQPVDADVALIHGLFKRTWPLFTERYERFLPNIAAIGAWLEDNGQQILHRFARHPRTLLHGDYRLDNLFFDAPTSDAADGVTVIDFQGIRAGNPMVDVAYFLRPNMTPSEADAAEEDLVRTYHTELVAAGVRDYPWEQCRADYTLAMVWLAMQGAFLLGALDLSHERGVELIDRAVERSSPAMARIDLASLRV